MFILSATFISQQRQVLQNWLTAYSSFPTDRSKAVPLLQLFLVHNENTPIQIYWKVYNQIKDNFQIKKSDILYISAQNIDCKYSLEPPRRGGSNEYTQSMYFCKIKK